MRGARSAPLEHFMRWSDKKIPRMHKTLAALFTLSLVGVGMDIQSQSAICGAGRATWGNWAHLAVDYVLVLAWYFNVKVILKLRTKWEDLANDALSHAVEAQKLSIALSYGKGSLPKEWSN